LAFAYDQNALINLAKSVIRAETENRKPPKAQQHSPVRPVFVTIAIANRILGCRGSLESRTDSLESEVILAARSAAKHDPRYPPIYSTDLKKIEVTITVIDSLMTIISVDSLKPEDGLVLRSGSKIGVVLPWEGKDPKTRLKWAYKKAGVDIGSPCTLQLMKAERFKG
jgi:AMMECR1 domain-containing protein